MKNIVYIIVFALIYGCSTKDDNTDGSFPAMYPLNLSFIDPNTVVEDGDLSISNSLQIDTDGNISPPIEFYSLGMMESISTLPDIKLYGIDCGGGTDCPDGYTFFTYYGEPEPSDITGPTTIEKNIAYFIEQSNGNIDTLKIDVLQTFEPATLEVSMFLNETELEKFDINGEPKEINKDEITFVKVMY